MSGLKARLLCLTDPRRGQVYELPQPMVTVGGACEGDGTVCIPHWGLAKRHAVFSCADDTWQVKRYTKHDRVCVNDEAVDEAVLSHGDTIRLRDVELRFLAAGSFVFPEERLEVKDAALARALGDAVTLGSAFAFVELPASVRSVVGLTQPEAVLRARNLVCLAGEEAVEIFGVSLQPPPLAALRLAAVTSDKGLYHLDRDDIHLLVLDLGAGSGVAEVLLEQGGREFGCYPVFLDEQGCGCLTLTQLPIGVYEARLRNDEAMLPCAFTVAEYRLAPLVARVVRRQLDGDRFEAVLRVEAFGQPLDGPVVVELHAGGVRRERTEAVACKGLVEVVFTLTGEGPFVLNLQRCDHPEQTAVVPLTGSRQAEREPTCFSRLGCTVDAALMPGPESLPVRGLFVREGPTCAAPFTLDRVATARARLTVHARAEAVRVICIDPTAGNRVEHLWPPAPTAARDLVPGQTVEIPVPPVLGVVVIGAYVEGCPWEGHVVLVRPAGLSPRLRLPQQALPGEEVEVAFEGLGEGPASVYVVVKDARLLTQDTPQSALAARLKAHADGVNEVFGDGPLASRLSECAAPRTEDTDMLCLDAGFAVAAAPAMEEGARRSMPMSRAAPSVVGRLGDALSSVGEALEDVMDAVAPGAEAEADELLADFSDTSDAGAREEAPSTVEHIHSEEEPEVLLAEKVPVTAGGTGRVRFSLPGAQAGYRVEALVVRGLDWVLCEGRFHARREPYAHLALPAFVHPDDVALGQLRASCAGGRMRVSLTREGQAVPLLQGDEVMNAGCIQEAELLELCFAAVPGAYEARVEDAQTGVVDVVTGTVEAPGAFRFQVQAMKLLQPGEGIDIAEVPGGIHLRLLPGLEQPFQALVQANTSYAHACCEQTAVILLSACALYAFSSGRERKKAESVICAGIRREETMWIPGKGLRMYPGRGGPDSYWGPMAVPYLFEASLMAETLDTPGLIKALKGIGDLARDVGKAYGLTVPPAKPSNARDAYLMARLGGDREGAIAWVRDWAGKAPAAQSQGDRFLDSKVGRRAEAAYAAAVLAETGQARDLAVALPLANEVVGAINEEGRLYSTYDSAAAMALMAALERAGVTGGAAEVEADGRTLKTVELVDAAADLQRVVCRGGVASVQVTRWIEERWDELESTVPVEVVLCIGSRLVTTCRPGDAIDLVVRIPKGYQTGDLLWVCLPAALARVVGGGQAKKFSLDFAGADELVVPLAATAPTLGRDGGLGSQHLAVCVRNMFEEERVGFPGLQSVTVAPADSTWVDRAFHRVRHLLD